MQPRKATKQGIIDTLRRLRDKSPDGRVPIRMFEEDTGWRTDVFYKFWPEQGRKGAYDEAGVQMGVSFGEGELKRKDDSQVAILLAEVVELLRGKFPGCRQFMTLKQVGKSTVLRGEKWDIARLRLINAYLSLPPDQRRGDEVDRFFHEELNRLDRVKFTTSVTPVTRVADGRAHLIQVSEEFVKNVVEFRERGEEEQRQLAARFFVEVLGYKRSRVWSEHKNNDVRVHDRRNRPWLVVEVKPSLGNDRDKRSARRQAFDYAHRVGLRFVVISDGDYYEVYDRCAGERLSYDEMRQGSFHLSTLRSRDADLLSLLAAER